MKIKLKCAKDHFQCLHLPLIRCLMNTVFKWDLLPEGILGNGLICGQHKVFDQLGCHISVMGTDLCGTSVLTHYDLGFLYVKINGASCVAAFSQDAGKPGHPLKEGDQLPVLLTGCILRIFDQLIYIRIGHPCIGMNHAFTDLMCHDLAVSINIHKAGQHQPVLSLLQGADSVG